jgi:chromosome segregation ATPase
MEGIMTNAGITKELEALRAEVDRLTRAREEEAAQQQEAVELSQELSEESSEEDSSQVSQQRSIDVSEADKDSEDDLSFQIQELVDALEEEIKGTNPVTMLVVFAFGILIGRFLPR